MIIAARVVGAVGGTLTAFWALWCDWIAFFGGTFPIPFINWSTPGGFWQGLVFLVVVDPILVGLVSWVLVWIVTLIFALAAGVPKEFDNDQP